MSTFPSQVPTSVFRRSNSGEPALGVGVAVSPALRDKVAASRRVVPMVVSFVFIDFGEFVVICFTFTPTTNGPPRSGQGTSLFCHGEFLPKAEHQGAQTQAGLRGLAASR